MSRVVKLSEHRELFKNLLCIDVLLTNKCNLRCSYCFQQHTDEHNARFTLESMRETWNWLRDINDRKGKKLQFFGGEPMLHRDFILEFLRQNRDEFEAQKGVITTTIVSNGLLFDEEFLKEYLSYPGTEIAFSIDTIDATKDVRGLTQKQIDTILDAISMACKHGSRSTVAARINISRDNVKGFKETFLELHKRGLRRFWFHPLVHSFENGLLVWSDDVWEEWRRDVMSIIDEGYDFERYTIIEGVGIKQEVGITGVTDIAMDGSGDFTSCYVWINQKDEVLGNVFKDELLIDKYLQMKDDYDHMISTETQCLACDHKNLCFQFSSGNKAIDGRMYRPDEMCEKMVSLYVETNDRIAQTRFRKKVEAMFRGYYEEGEIVLTRALVFLIKAFLDRGSLTDPQRKTNLILPTTADVQKALDFIPVTHRQLLTLFSEVISGKTMVPSNVDSIVATAVFCDESVTSEEVYRQLTRHVGVTVPSRAIVGVDPDLVYITMMHMIVLSRLAYFHAVAWGGYE